MSQKPRYFLTAYGIARKHGFEGSEEEWLDSLTAYGVACRNGFQGSVSDWLDSLTAYALAQQAGYSGSIEEWVRLLGDPVPVLEVGEVNTLPPGSRATVEITGDVKHPKLNFGIPEGVGVDNALPLNGSKPMTGDLIMAGHNVAGVASPADPGHAANKGYVDKADGEVRGYIDDQILKTLRNAELKSDYATVLEACMNAPEAGGTFFAVVGSALAAAEDSAWTGGEVQYLILRDKAGGPRTTVLAFRYTANCKVKVRTIFSGAWLGDWVYIDDPSTVIPILRGGTGATDKTTALYNLGVASFGIANGIDLNTAVVPGFYRIEGVHPNLPTDSNGAGKCKYGQMLVLHGAGDTVAQIAFDYTNTTPYVRTGNPPAVGGSGEWTKWRPLLSQILDDSLYGDTFPANAEKGQIFFLKG